MKKYLWGGAALIVAGAAACYAGVDYAARHPESILGRYGAVVTTAAVGYQPVDTMSTAATGCPTASPSKPVVAGMTVVAVAEPTPAPSEQVLETIPVEPNVGWGNPVEEPIDPTVDLGGVVTIDQLPQPMPYADEEAGEDGNEEGWSFCPILGCDDVRPALVRIKKLRALRAMQSGAACQESGDDLCLGGIIQQMFGGNSTDDAACENQTNDDACGVMIFKKWLYLNLMDRSNTCEETSGDDSSFLSRISKWFTKIMREQGTDSEQCEPPASEEMLPESVIKKLFSMMMMDGAAAPVEEENATENEQSETPPMMESEHRYHHSGCPYMGGCPYCPPCYPPQSAVQIPETQDNPAAEESSESARPQLLFNPVKVNKKPLWELYLRSLGAEPCVPFTDTMEFRPSDAGSTVVPTIPYFPLPY
jgi:hypothetical protein